MEEWQWKPAEKEKCNQTNQQLKKNWIICDFDGNGEGGAKKFNQFDGNGDAIVMVHFEFGQNFTFSEIIFQENQHFLKLSIIWFVWTADNTIPERGDILIPSKSTSVQKSKKRNRTSNTILVVKVPLRVFFVRLISDILSSSSLTSSLSSSKLTSSSYILKAKKFAEPPFQSKKLRAKKCRKLPKICRKFNFVRM